MTIREMLEERGKLAHQMQAIVDLADKENRDLTTEEDAKFNELHERDMQLKRKVERQEKLDLINSELDEPRVGDRRSSTVGETVTSGLEGEDRRRREGMELTRAEASNALIHAWLQQQLGMDLTERHQQAVRQLGVKLRREHLDLQMGNTEHLRQLQQQMLSMHPSMRSNIVPQPMSLNTTSGDGIISEDFMRRIDMTLLWFGTMLQTSEVIVTGAGNDLKWPTGDDTSNVGEQLDQEASIGTSVPPTIASRTLGAFKFSSKPVLVSAEILQDAEFDLPGLLGDWLGERLGRILNTRLTTGGGDTTIDGLVPRAQVGKTAAATNAIAADELIDLHHSVDIAYRTEPGVGWLMHDSVIAVIRKLKDSHNQYLWQPGLQAGVPDRLLGSVVNVNNDMADTLEANAKPIAFGSLRRYKVRLVRGIRMRRLVERYADTDQEAFVGFLRADGDLLTTAAIKTLQMASG